MPNSSIVRTSLTIVECKDLPSGESVLVLDNQVCPLSSGSPDDSTKVALGLATFVFYGLVPFVVISCVTHRAVRTGTLERKMRRSPYFRILAGWAIKPYRPRAYLWEIFSAIVKVLMVGSAVLLANDSAARSWAHGAIVAVTMIATLIFHPYKDPAGNRVVIAFCISDLIGIIAKMFPGGSDLELLMQTLFIVSLLFSLLMVTRYASERARAKAELARHDLHKEKSRKAEAMHLAHQKSLREGGGGVKRSKSHAVEEVKHSLSRFAVKNKAASNLSRCEIGMLVP